MSTLTIRADSAVERALEYLLAERAGETKSEVVRAAILELERATRRARLREESAALRDSAEYQAEVREIQEEMEHLRAW